MRRVLLSSPNNHLPFADFVKLKERRLSSADVIVENRRGEVLVVQTSYLPHWSLPGGIIDARESPRRAAARELYEETGLRCDADDLQFAAVLHRRVSDVDIYGFVFQLTAPFDERQAVVIDGREIVAADWVSKSDVNTEARGHYNRSIRNWASDAPQAYIEDQAYDGEPSS